MVLVFVVCAAGGEGRITQWIETLTTTPAVVQQHRHHSIALRMEGTGLEGETGGPGDSGTYPSICEDELTSEERS